MSEQLQAKGLSTMTSITVWAFDNPNAATEALRRVQAKGKQGLLDLQDAAIVSWPEGKKRPKTQQLHNMAGAGALGGAFWGMLFGMIFLMPVLGAAIGAAAGAAGGSAADMGIDDDFIDSLRERVVPGTSALFLLVDDVVIEKVGDVFEGMNVEIIQTNLTEVQESELRDQFHLV
jgi:uncharacterized membrane protein